MRVGCGLFLLLIAACLGWGAFNWSHTAAIAGNKSGLEGFVSRMANEERDSQNLAVKFGVGAAIFGILALIVLASGGGGSQDTYQQPPPPRYEEVRPIRPRRPSVEERLETLDALFAKGMISEQEHKTRRQRILEEL